jgi:hypothetical protein
MTIYVSALVSLVGVLVYAFSSNAKVAEVGHVAYWVGLLVFLSQLAPHVVGTIR